MARQRSAWVRDVKVFVGFTLLNGVLVCAGSASIAGCGAGGGLFTADPVLDVWLWAFAFPCNATRHLDWAGPSYMLFLANPFLYGLAWWAVWKMVKLLRTKPAD